MSNTDAKRLLAAHIDPDDGRLVCIFKNGETVRLCLARLKLPPGAPVVYAAADEFGAGIDFVREDGTRTDCGIDLVQYLTDPVYRAHHRKRGNMKKKEESMFLSDVHSGLSPNPDAVIDFEFTPVEKDSLPTHVHALSEIEKSLVLSDICYDVLPVSDPSFFLDVLVAFVLGSCYPQSNRCVRTVDDLARALSERDYFVRS